MNPSPLLSLRVVFVTPVFDSAFEVLSLLRVHHEIFCELLFDDEVWFVMLPEQSDAELSEVQVLIGRDPIAKARVGEWAMGFKRVRGEVDLVMRDKA
jgi:hypothetical protein